MRHPSQNKYKRRCVRSIMDVDHDHPAWEDGNPTYQECPDAFIVYSRPLWAKPSSAKRRTPHASLSGRRLRKRLFQMGYRGEKLRHTMALVLQNGSYANWKVDDFRKAFGRRIGWKLLRFVSAPLLILDEFGYYITPGFAELVQKSMSMYRKFNSQTIEVQQSIPLPTGPTPIRVYFQR
jgi:hypothetical protein